MNKLTLLLLIIFQFSFAQNIESKIKIDIAELNDEDTEDIKKHYRDDSWLCSLNSSRRVGSNEKDVSDFFREYQNEFGRRKFDKVFQKI